MFKFIDQGACTEAQDLSASQQDVARRCGDPSRLAFTLVEMLLVVAVIALLIAVMLPMFSRSRSTTQKLVCLANLHGIHAGSVAYATANRNRFPDPFTTGNFFYRMAPGKKTPNDPGAFPETFGWQAVLEGQGYMSRSETSWVCPGAQPWMQAHGNTYAFSIAKVLKTTSTKTLLLWDNYSSYPGLSGFRGPFNGYTLPAALKLFPHELADKSLNGAAALYIGGNVQIRGDVD